MSLDLALLERIVEAALLASPTPLTLPQLAALFDGEDNHPASAELQQVLATLTHRCDGRGVVLVEVAGGWRYQVAPAVHPWVSRLWQERRTRYSRATLETLALIAYRQPVTRAEIEQVRGVTVSSTIIQTLEERGWIHTVGHRDVPGRPALLGTTQTFLEHFGLRRLEDLPPLANLGDVLDNTLQQNPPAELPSDDAESITTIAPLAGAPDAAPGTRAADRTESEFNAVAMTTVAVDQADSDTKGHPHRGGRSQNDE